MEDLDNIEEALERIEAAIKENSLAQLLRQTVWAVYGLALIFWAISAWHSKWRYVAQYQVSPHKVTVAKEPHDCDFMYAPIGAKFCSYEQRTSTVRWGRTPGSGQPILSTDDGKTWESFTPDSGVDVPSYSTLEQVNVDWDKKDD